MRGRLARMRFFPTAAVCTLFAASALAQTNLVANPGFETGDFTGWTLSGESRPDHSFVSSPAHYPGWHEWLPHSGNAFAALGAIGSQLALSQTIPTTPGESYTFSFHLGSDGETPNEIFVFWNASGFGLGVLGAVNQPETPGHDLLHGPAASAYGFHSFTVDAYQPATTISFAARNDQGWWALDDVSVTPVPEPSSLVLYGAGILAVAGCHTRRQRVRERILRR